MKIVELMAGSRSIGKVAESMGFTVYSVDKFIEKDMSFVGGVEELTKEMITDFLKGEPDFIWASPVCSAWSKTGWFHYWDTAIYKRTAKFVAKKEFAIESVEMVRKVIEIFSWFPGAIFFMENPEGMLFKHPVINEFVRREIYDLKRHVVTYCQYGDTVMKPTHLWTNSKYFVPKRCMQGDSCHMKSPRNTQLGIRSKANAYERSKIPKQLCREVLEAAQQQPKPTQLTIY